MRSVPLLCSSQEALGLPDGQGMEKDMAATEAVVPTGSFFKKKKKKNPSQFRQQDSTPPHLPQWPATWAPASAVLSPSARRRAGALVSFRYGGFSFKLGREMD